MKKSMKSFLGIAVALAMIGGGAAYGAAGGGYPAGKITIDGNKPAEFGHQKHVEAGLGCAACHHNAKHEPVSAEAIGAMKDTSVLRCVSCHNDSFAKAELRQKKDVFHARCRECHQNGYNGKKGPTSCGDCHVKKDKKKLEGC